MLYRRRYGLLRLPGFVGSTVSLSMEITEHIMKIRDDLSKKKIEAWTPDQLSRAMTKLALLNMTLGGMVMDLYGRYKDKEMQRKVGVANLELELSKDNPMTVARTMAQVKGVELYEQENEAEHDYKILNALYRDTESLISVLQSRLRHLGNEQYQQKNNLEPEAADEG